MPCAYVRPKNIEFGQGKVYCGCVGVNVVVFGVWAMLCMRLSMDSAYHQNMIGTVMLYFGFVHLWLFVMVFITSRAKLYAIHGWSNQTVNILHEVMTETILTSNPRRGSQPCGKLRKGAIVVELERRDAEWTRTDGHAHKVQPCFVRVKQGWTEQSQQHTLQSNVKVLRPVCSKQAAERQLRHRQVSVAGMWALLVLFTTQLPEAAEAAAARDREMTALLITAESGSGWPS